MNPVYQKLTTCYKSLRALTDFQPKFALVLGTGLARSPTAFASYRP